MNYMITMYDTLDPSGDNSKMFHAKWDSLSDNEMDKVVRAFFADDKEQFYLEIIEFERDLSLENIMKCAKIQNVPLFEYVAVPHINGSLDNVVVTPEPVPVGYIHAKRMQQTLLKKNAGSISIKKRNPKTGQVINEDKNARNSNVETYSLVALGADDALREFMGPRADDEKAKNQMYGNISRDGFTTLESLDNDPENKTALTSLDEYFIMQGFRTNLVMPINVIPTS